jgi:hypothetical protein
MAVGIGAFDYKVLAFDPPQLSQPATEAINIGVWRDGEPANARLLVLRTRCERPCRRGRSTHK